MPCVPNMSTMDMMMNMNAGGVGPPQSLMMNGPGGPGQVGPPPHMMMGPNGPMFNGPMDQQMVSPMHPVAPEVTKPAKGGRSGTRSATPKTKNSAKNNQQQPTTMMVQGKPAVMVPPNMNASNEYFISLV